MQIFDRLYDLKQYTTTAPVMKDVMLIFCLYGNFWSQNLLFYEIALCYSINQVNFKVVNFTETLSKRMLNLKCTFAEFTSLM